jgi:hypothetical protein
MEFDENGNQILNAEEIFDVLDGALRAQELSGRCITILNLLGALEGLKAKATDIHVKSLEG